MKIKLNKSIMMGTSFIFMLMGVMFASASNKTLDSRTLSDKTRAVPNTATIYSIYGSNNDLRFIKYNTNGNRLRVPRKKIILSSGHQDIYCINSEAATPRTMSNGEQGVKSYTLETSKLSGGQEEKLLYALEHDSEYELGSLKDYYIRQLVAHYATGDMTSTLTGEISKRISSPEDPKVLTNAQNVAKNMDSGNFKTTRDVSISLNADKLTFTHNKSNARYDSNWITINTTHPTGLIYNAQLISSKVNISGAPSGTIIIDVDGNPLENGVLGTRQKFQIRVPESAMTGNVNISISVESTFNVGVVRRYTTSEKDYQSSVFQPMALRDTEQIKKSTASIHSGVINNGGSIVVNLVDENNNPLSGGKFQVQSATTNVTTGILTTPNSGSVTFSDLPPGQYQVIETEPPSGYIGASTVTVTVTSGGKTPVTVKNQRAKGGIKIIKVNELGERLNGATFQLKSGSTVLRTITTSGNGEATLSDIPTGNYTLVETSPPAGHEINKDQKNMEASVIQGETSVITVTNKRITGTINALKVDSLNSDMTLAGAVFGLYDKSGVRVRTAVSDASGIARFEGVPYGAYTLKEETAPKGYVLNSSGVSCSIETEGQYKTYPVYNNRLRDYLFTGYNVKDSGGNIVGTLESNKSYKVNTQITSIYKDLNVPSNANLANVTIGKLKYAVAVNDGTVNQSASSITTSNIRGNVIKRDEIPNIPIRDLSSVWQNFEFKLPDDESYSEVVIVVELEDFRDSDASNNKLVIKLPITNQRKDEIYIVDMQVYPNGSNKALVGNDVNVKLTVNANSLKSYNADSKIVISGPPGFNDNQKMTIDKVVYGVSLENQGEVYFKFKPTVPGHYTITPTVSITGSSSTVSAQSINVVYPSEPEAYASVPERNQADYNDAWNIKTYVKVRKRDKDKIIKGNCDSSCQLDDVTNKTVCPTHDTWGWGDWYDAFVPMKSTPASGISESYNITGLKFRSKLTENNASNYPLAIDPDGWVNMLNSSSVRYAQVKAGYGFDIEIETKYENNLPEVFKKGVVSNSAPKNSKWSEYSVLSGAGSSVPYIYANKANKTVDQQVLSSSGAVSVAVPSMNDLIIENPDQLYMQLPIETNEYYMVNEGYKQTFSDNRIKQRLVVSESNGPVIVSGKYTHTRKFEIRNNNSSTVADKRGYYIDENVGNSDDNIITFYNRYAGIGLKASTRLHDRVSVPISISGGRYDDLKNTNE